MKNLRYFITFSLVAVALCLSAAVACAEDGWKEVSTWEEFKAAYEDQSQDTNIRLMKNITVPSLGVRLAAENRKKNIDLNEHTIDLGSTTAFVGPKARVHFKNGTIKSKGTVFSVVFESAENQVFELTNVRVNSDLEDALRVQSNTGKVIINGGTNLISHADKGSGIKIENPSVGASSARIEINDADILSYKGEGISAEKNWNGTIRIYKADIGTDPAGNAIPLLNLKKSGALKESLRGDTVKLDGKPFAFSDESGILGKILQITDSTNLNLSGKSYKLKPASFVHDGKAKRPALTIGKLFQGEEFDVSYESNVAIGTGRVKATGKGHFTGTITKTFEINPAKVAVKKPKAGKRKITVGYGAVRGGVKYRIACKQKGSGKWKYTTSTKTAKVIKKLKTKKYYYVKVRAYKIVKGKTYYGMWSLTKKVRVK